MILNTRFEEFAPAIAALPDRERLTKEDILQPVFRLHEEETGKGLLEIYYSPIDVVNESAKVVLIGICPGFAPTQIAYRAAWEGLRDGLAPDAIQHEAKRRAQWVGQTRRNLAMMLDALNVPQRVGAPNGLALFDTHTHLIHSSAAVRYPVFVNGANYSGYGPDLHKMPILREYTETLLAEELAHIGPALVVLLGRSVSESVQAVLGETLAAHNRLVISAPHPSGGPGQAARLESFQARLPALREMVDAWFAVCSVR